MNNKPRVRRRAFGVCTACIMLVTVAQAAEFIPLGHRSGCDTSRAEDVSDDGTVAVGDCSGAARWTVETGWVALEDLPSGRHPRKANGVSVDGSVVVGDAQIDRGQLESFRWTLADGMESLGDNRDNEALAVSADGSVVVGRGSAQSSDEAYRWTEADGRMGLGGISGDNLSSVANGVSADGSVVVGSGPSASGIEATRWTEDGGMVGLGDLPGGDFYCEAHGVSADGNVVVGIGNSALGREAFIWTSEGGMVGLGDLPGGGFESRALAVSADGRVVVGYSDTGSFDDGFVWTQASGMQRLEDILVADGTAGLSGWSGLVPWGISDNGQWVSGSGTNPAGLFEAFLVRLPDGINPEFEINAGLNGSWWNGPDRSGEGVQLEISAGADGSLIFLVTIYSYDTMGNQIFMIALGTVNGDTAEVEVFITEGGMWGDDFDPMSVNETQWGSGTFTASSCDGVLMELRPNAEFQALGYTNLSYDLVRLTTSLLPCPTTNPSSQ